MLLTFLEYAIFMDIILSWVLQGRENSFTRMLHIFTEPILAPARKLQYKFSSNLPLDFSPFIAILFISILRTLIHSIF